MKNLFILIFLFSSPLTKSQCLNTDSLFTNTITHENAIANWTNAPSAHHYIIHYRVLGTQNWSNLANIDSTMTSRLIPLLQPLTSYEWEILTFCDSVNQPNSGWSYTDTFTTIQFTPTVFDPSIITIIGNTNCNQNTSFSIIASQLQDEPDISTTIFTSDRGHFEINTLNSGDNVGNASYSSSFLNFNTDLVVDFTMGSNYAKINLIDSTSSTVGFFVIENLSSGIKVTSYGPIDANNYTNGYISQINFTDLFVNPNHEGNIVFTADISSELGDNVMEIDSSIYIVCTNTNIENSNTKRELIKITDILGRETKEGESNILFYIYSNGTIKKKLILK